MPAVNIHDDFVWDFVVQNLPSNRKIGKTLINICCPVCPQRGETPDRRFRCAVYKNSDGFGFHCFNCANKLKFVHGSKISYKLEQFVSALGATTNSINKLKFKAFQINSITPKINSTYIAPPIDIAFDFSEIALPLPKDTFHIIQLLEEGFDDPDFLSVAEYLLSRGEELASSHDFSWSPKDPKRLIIPCYDRGKVVGYTARAIEPDKYRYIKIIPHEYLFNMDKARLVNRKYNILVEGVLDAITVDGIGLLGSELSKKQIAWLNASGKTNILCPDRDKHGFETIEIALQNNWHVAFPGRFHSDQGLEQWWSPDIKDATAAAKEYGKLYTLYSILQTSTNDKMKINYHRKFFTEI